MENIENYVRNSLIINIFNQIYDKCQGRVNIIPLKGIMLLMTLYKDDIGRRDIADIDFIIDRKDLSTVIEILDNEGFDVDKKMYVKGKNLHRRKFSFYHRNGEKCDIDVHTSLITKRFIRNTLGTFENDALQYTCKINFCNREIVILNDIYNWMFLAYHGTMHLFHNKKWIDDLYYLQREFDNNKILQLVDNVRKYHFERLYNSAVTRMIRNYERGAVKLPLLEIHGCRRFFDVFVSPGLNRGDINKQVYQLMLAYLEFAMISQGKDRVREYFRLLFPNLNILQHTYKGINNKFLLVLMYPVNLLVVLTTSMLYSVIMLGFSMRRRK